MKIQIPDEDVLTYIKQHFVYDAIVGSISRDGVILKRTAKITTGRRMYKIKIHQIAWFLYYGEWATMFIDHIDGDRTNNRSLNLRLVTPRQNCYNSRKRTNTTSIYKGVSYIKMKKPVKPWRAYIYADGKRISIGRFVTEEEAALAYDEKAKELHGEYACLNFGENNAIDRKIRDGK